MKQLIIIGLILSLILLNGCSWIVNKSVYDKACQSYGFNQSTDWYWNTQDIWDETPLSIECDGIVFFRECRVNFECKEENKWGECIKKTRSDLSCFDNGKMYLFHDKFLPIIKGDLK